MCVQEISEFYRTQKSIASTIEKIANNGLGVNTSDVEIPASSTPKEAAIPSNNPPKLTAVGDADNSSSAQPLLSTMEDAGEIRQEEYLRVSRNENSSDHPMDPAGVCEEEEEYPVEIDLSEVHSLVDKSVTLTGPSMLIDRVVERFAEGDVSGVYGLGFSYGSGTLLPIDLKKPEDALAELYTHNESEKTIDTSTTTDWGCILAHCAMGARIVKSMKQPHVPVKNLFIVLDILYLSGLKPAKFISQEKLDTLQNRFASRDWLNFCWRASATPLYAGADNKITFDPKAWHAANAPRTNPAQLKNKPAPFLKKYVQSAFKNSYNYALLVRPSFYDYIGNVTYPCKADDFHWLQLRERKKVDVAKNNWDKMTSTQMLFQMSRINFSDRRFAGSAEEFYYCDLIGRMRNSVNRVEDLTYGNLPLLAALTHSSDQSWYRKLTFAKSLLWQNFVQTNLGLFIAFNEHEFEFSYLETLARPHAHVSCK